MVGAGGALKYGDDAAFDYEKPNYCVCGGVGGQMIQHQQPFQLMSDEDPHKDPLKKIVLQENPLNMISTRISEEDPHEDPLRMIIL